jgi:DNA sulfur modification protein DndB
MAEKIGTIAGVVRRTIVSSDGSKRDYYLGSIRSDVAKALTFVPVALEETKNSPLNENMENGYQRQGSPARMKKFTQFLMEHPLSVIPPVVLSGRSHWKFTGDDDFGSLDIYAPAAVMDGQHRLGGLVILFEKHATIRSIDFMLIPDLPLAEEKIEFTIINGTQRGVSKGLVEYIKGTYEAEVAELLNEDEDSPFAKRITLVKRKPGELFSFASVVNNVRRTFDGKLNDLLMDTKLEYMKRYWTIIADEFSEEWDDIERLDAREPMQFKLLETTGLSAWSLAGRDILAPAFNPVTHTMDWEAVAKLIRIVAASGLDLSKDGEFAGLTGEVGAARIHKKIQSMLPQMTIQTDDDSE